MYFFRKNYTGNWITKALTKELEEEAFESYKKVVFKIYNFVQGLQDIPEDYRKIIFERMCPSFESIISDVIDYNFFKQQSK